MCNSVSRVGNLLAKMRTACPGSVICRIHISGLKCSVGGRFPAIHRAPNSVRERERERKRERDRERGIEREKEREREREG